MAELQWVRLYIDMFGKDKIKKLRRLPSGNDILLLWIMLLAKAGECNAGGMIYITPKIPFSKEDISDGFKFKLSTVERALKAFVDFDMLEISEDGFISVKNWEEYQNTEKLSEIREYNRAAKQRSRERQKKSQDNNGNVSCDVNDNVNDMSLTSQGQCHGSQDTEEEEEEEELDIQSFILSDCAKNNLFDVNDKKRKLMGGTLGEGVVMLSDAQKGDLLERLSIDEFDKYVAIIRDCEKNGKHFTNKTHYQAILDMANKDRRLRAHGKA